MKTFTIYPYIRQREGEHANPYISDFAHALEATGAATVKNRPAKNPLLSILAPRKWADVTVLNWFECIPDYKHGLLQTAAAVALVACFRLTGRKIVWVFHNKQPHDGSRLWLKRRLERYIARRASVIVTHSSEGIDILRKRYPKAARKAVFMDHPTKDRTTEAQTSAEYDLLVWGSITPYKGVDRLLDYLNGAEGFAPRLCIAGKCADEGLRSRIEGLLTPHTTFIPEGMPFDRLRTLIGRSRFVLVPYQSETVLSSGVLMDSLSFGARVIGPDVGSFRDYERCPQLCVYTYKTLEDLPRIVADADGKPYSLDCYRQFLNDHDWPHFAERLLNILNTPTR